jgi:hypothetical protein
MRCIHCGCTEARACIMLFVEQPLQLQHVIEEARLEAGRRPPLPNAEMGCAWISTEPPVCSNPSCVRKHLASLKVPA